MSLCPSPRVPAEEERVAYEGVARPRIGWRPLVGSITFPLQRRRAMHVAITGAGGFLGKRLIHQLLQRGTIIDAAGKAQSITKVIACDLSLAGLADDPRVERVEADV